MYVPSSLICCFVRMIAIRALHWDFIQRQILPLSSIETRGFPGKKMHFFYFLLVSPMANGYIIYITNKSLCTLTFGPETGKNARKFARTSALQIKRKCAKWPVCSAILALCPPVPGTALKKGMFATKIAAGNICIMDLVNTHQTH